MFCDLYRVCGFFLTLFLHWMWDFFPSSIFDMQRLIMLICRGFCHSSTSITASISKLKACMQMQFKSWSNLRRVQLYFFWFIWIFAHLQCYNCNHVLLLLLLGENDTEKGDHFVISLHTIPVSQVLVFLRVNYTTHHIVCWSFYYYCFLSRPLIDSKMTEFVSHARSLIEKGRFDEAVSAKLLR